MSQTRCAWLLKIGTCAVYCLGFLLWVVIWALLALATITLLDTRVSAVLG
jgi:hypothetical protein